MSPPLIEWKSEYAIGIAAIDRQHQELFSRADRFFKAVEADEGYDQTRHLLAFLESYVIAHFQAEERYMERLAYPEINEHKAAHRHFRDQMDLLKHDLFYEFGEASNATVKLFHLVNEWLRDHICHTDRKLARFVAKAGKLEGPNAAG